MPPLVEAGAVADCVSKLVGVVPNASSAAKENFLVLVEWLPVTSRLTDTHTQL